MKLFLIGLALLATAYGEYSSEYQVPQDSLAVLEEIETLNQPSNQLADNGYRYKTVRRFRARHRRDVNELVSPEYLPPNTVSELTSAQYFPPAQTPQAPIVSDAPVADIPIINNEYLAPLQQTETILADDGYRYKTVRRFKIRRH